MRVASRNFTSLCFETAPRRIKAVCYRTAGKYRIQRHKRLYKAKNTAASSFDNLNYSTLNMSILPYVLRDVWGDPWSGVTRPSRLFDQTFGNTMTDEDLALSMLNRFGPQALSRPPQSSGMSEVVNNENEFRVGLDVRHFKPEELKVTTKDNRVIINAKHEERPDEHGYIMREFTRQYVLPKDVDPNTVTSGLSRDGVLTIRAPKKALEAPEERAIPITHEPAQKKK